MVFGWGKKKASGFMESSQPVKQISLVAIDSLLEEKKNSVSNAIIEKTKAIRSEIELSRKAIIQLFLQLESDDLGSQDIDKHLKIIVERGKNAVISGVRKETSKTFDEITKFSDVTNLNSEVAQFLKRIGDALGPNSRVMHVFARKYADRLKEILADATKYKANLQKLVDEYGTLDSRISKILEDKKKFSDSKKENKTMDNSIMKIKEEIKETNKFIQSLEEEINNLKSSKGYTEFLQIIKNLESLDGEEEKIKKQIDFQFSKISRPLGKYRYVSSLEKPLRSIMEKLIDEPFNIITDDNKGAIIEVLQAVIKSAVAGSISVKDADKSVEQIEETITMLDEFVKSKNNLSNNRNALKQTILFNNKDLDEKEKKLFNTKEHKKHLETEITNLENKINKATTLLPQLIKNLESKLDETLGPKFNITED
jgi:DNA repair ATPase RecN